MLPVSNPAKSGNLLFYVQLATLITAIIGVSKLFISHGEDRQINRNNTHNIGVLADAVKMISGDIGALKVQNATHSEQIKNAQERLARLEFSRSST